MKKINFLYFIFLALGILFSSFIKNPIISVKESQRAKLPKVMDFPKVLSNKGKFYIISQGNFPEFRKRFNYQNTGSEADSLPGAIFEFIPATGIARKISDLPKVKCFFGAAVLNNKIYIAGGRDSKWNELADVDAFDLTTQKWEKASNMLVSRSRMGFESVGNNLYAFYGTSGKISYETYSPDAKKWNPVNPKIVNGTINKIENCAASVVVDNKIFIFATSGKGFQEYDQTNNIMIEMPAPPFKLEYFDAISMNRKIFVGGGCTMDSIDNNIYRFNPFDGLWQKSGKVNPPRCRSGLLNFSGNTIMFLGGSFSAVGKPAELTDEIFIYIPVNK